MRSINQWKVKFQRILLNDFCRPSSRKGSIFLLVTILGCATTGNASRDLQSDSLNETRLQVASDSWKGPKQIVLIRHGEKLDDYQSGLSPQGCERAYQLLNFFSSWVKDQPISIFAQQPHKAGASLRPLETMAPTAQQLRIKINNSFLRDDIESLANEILTNSTHHGELIIISWEHTMIPLIAQKLGVSFNGSLAQWPGKVYDQAWIISYAQDGRTPPKLQIVAEHVLPTDIAIDQSGVDNWGLPEQSNFDDTLQVPTPIQKECLKGNQKLDNIVRLQTLREVPGL